MGRVELKRGCCLSGLICLLLKSPLCPRDYTVGQPQLEELVFFCLDTRHTHAVDIDFTSETV